MGGQIHVTHCNDYTNHSLVKSKLGSSTVLVMAKTNQNGIFFSIIFSFRVELTLKTCSYSKKQLENLPPEQNLFLSPTFS